jgi:NitT/TauT family transport system permease protein
VEAMSWRSKVTVGQLTLIAVFLLAWQYLPEVKSISHSSNLFNTFFVSSPSRIAVSIWDLLTGSNGSFLIWTYLEPTLYASLFGTAVGITTGAALGLLLSNSAFASAVLRPFVVAANATPRIAFVPIVVLLVGPSLTADVVLAILVVFFLAFFNAYEGGRSVTPEMLHNAELLGANRWRIAWYVRGPLAVAWTIAGLPITLSFALLTVVTSEVLTGYPGMGRLLSDSQQTADASLTFAVVIVLAVVGVLTIILADLLRSRVLHWWGK